MKEVVDNFISLYSLKSVWYGSLISKCNYIAVLDDIGFFLACFSEQGRKGRVVGFMFVPRKK